MFQSATLELAIGLCLLYLMFGGVCSTVREFIARLFSEREDLLIASVSRVLGASPPPTGGNAPVTSPASAGQPVKPTEANLASLVLGHPLVQSLAQATGRPSYLPARTFALALLDVLTPGGQATDDVKAVRNAVAAIESDKVRAALLPIVNQSANTLAELQANIERHFDDVMDRVSGVYKRNSQKIIVVIALVVTVVFNVDTLNAAEKLWVSPALRAQVVQEGSAVSRAGLSADGKAQGSTVDALPVGWYQVPKSSCEWGLKILGWLLSTFALTLGTPFWFELLTRFVNVRSTGPKPSSSTT
jgi:hypothetical protein